MTKPLLITGLVPGYPTPPLSLKIAQTLSQSGADILELSASFSEPIADGPTLQLAHQRVLGSSFSKTKAWELYSKIKQATHKPLFLIEYANIIYHSGIDTYYKRAATSGITYILIPDVPFEESMPFVMAAKKYGLAQIFMIAPTTTNERVKKIEKCAAMVHAQPKAKSTIPLSTFLYLVSITGVTGARQTVS